MRTTLAISIILAESLMATPHPAASPEATLEAAIYQAKVVGNLTGAIQQFQSLAKQYAGKPVAARALAELGEAEQKLGHATQAREAYARVMKEYPGQAQLVAMVRQDLAAMTESQDGPRNLAFERGDVGQVPEGWFVPAQLQRAGYSAELRRSGCHGTLGCVVISAPEVQPLNSFGNVMQSFSAAAYRGKTVRLRAWLRMESNSKSDAAQMWFRVDLPNRKVGAFDNMNNRPVNSAAWTQAEIVAKVEPDAEKLNIGVMSFGKGHAWVDGVTFEIIPDETPLTSKSLAPHNSPQNLDFAVGEVGRVPDGWMAAAGDVELSRGVCRSHGCVSIQLAQDNAANKFANIMQQVDATAYRGKTVRLRAWLRLDAATASDTAQMWFRVDRPNQKMGAFDNMSDRPVKSVSWSLAEIVAKVAADAEMLNIGVMSLGKGRAWVDGLTFEIVSEGSPATGKSYGNETALNLDFAQGQAGKIPDGWSASGHAEWSNQGCRSAVCASLWLEPDSKLRFGNMMQSVNAAPYRGKTVRLRSWLRLDSAASGDKAQMWFRVDLPEGEVGAFDNMDNRPVQSAVWTQAEIVGKVAADAEAVNFGVMSTGKGHAWVDGVTIEIVPDDTPVTTHTFAPNATPQNLDLVKGRDGGVPEGWIASAGQVSLTHEGCHGIACASVRLADDAPASDAFANLMQVVSAVPYRGKTVRLRAWLRLEAVTPGDTAQMWLRVDLPNHKMGAFDNMDDRPVKSAAWTQAEIVGKVAANADSLNFGVMATGKGRAWVDGVTIEVVPDSTPATGIKLKD